MGLTQIKSRLGIIDSQQDASIAAIIDSSEQFLLATINCGTDYYAELPAELEFITDELSIIAYNRVGDEGTKSTSDNGFSVSWEDDFLCRYNHLLDPYKNKTGNGPSARFYFM